MTKSVTTLIEPAMTAFEKATLTSHGALFDQFVAPYTDKAVDALYDYLQSPDETELAALQQQAQMIAPLMQMQMAQSTAINTDQVQGLTQNGELTRFMSAMQDFSIAIQTPMMAEAFEEASGGVTVEQNAVVVNARLKHAANTNSLSDMLHLSQTVATETQKKMMTGMVDIISSEKLVPFMQALASNVDKADFKKVVHFIAKTGKNMKDGFDQQMSLIKAGGLETDAQMMEAMQSIQTELPMMFLSAMSDAVQANTDDFGTARRIIQGVEASLLDSGILTEETFKAAYIGNASKSLRALKGYDAMADFDATKALKSGPKMK